MKILLIVYDNNSYLHYFPVGTASIAAILREAGHHVHIYNQDLTHWPEAHLKAYIETQWVSYDIVGLGMVAGYYPYRKLLKISEAINNCKNRGDFKYVLGGHLVSPAPEYFLLKTSADIAVLGEGEDTIKEICVDKCSINDV